MYTAKAYYILIIDCHTNSNLVSTCIYLISSDLMFWKYVSTCNYNEWERELFLSNSFHLWNPVVQKLVHWLQLHHQLNEDTSPWTKLIENLDNWNEQQSKIHAYFFPKWICIRQNTCTCTNTWHVSCAMLRWIQSLALHWPINVHRLYWSDSLYWRFFHGIELNGAQKLHENH